MTFVEGLGEMPEHWRVEQARWVLSRRRRPVPAGAGVVTAFRDGQVTLRQNRRMDGFTEAIQEIGYQGVRKGDLVVHAMDGFAGAIGVSDSDGKSSPVVHVYAGSDDVDLRFVAYVLRHLAGAGFVSSLAKGIRERSTSFDPATLAQLILPVPPLHDQRRIADFLDAKTARIDWLIQLRQRQIGLLRLRATCTIDEYLTTWRGPRVPISALCSRIVDCVNKTAPITSDETPFKMIRTTNVRGGVVDLEKANRVDAATFAIWNRRGRPLPKDVLLTREAPMGEVGLLDSHELVFLGQRVVLYRADASVALPEFIQFCLMSADVQHQMSLLGSGSLHPHLRVGDCLKFRVPAIPLDEQRTIVRSVASERARLSRIVAQSERLMGLMRQRREGLITAAICGQFDVTTARGVA